MLTLNAVLVPWNIISYFLYLNLVSIPFNVFDESTEIIFFGFCFRNPWEARGLGNCCCSCKERLSVTSLTSSPCVYVFKQIDLRTLQVENFGAQCNAFVVAGWMTIL